MLMTITEYADHRGVSRQTVYNALKSGRIRKEPCGKIESIGADLRWDPKATINAALEGGAAKVAQAARPRRSGPGPGGDDDEDDDGYDYQSERARREHYEANLKELKDHHERGELVRAADVEKAWTGILGALKTRLLGLPDRLCGTLATTDDPHAVQQILTDAITDLLEEAAGDVCP